MEYEIKITGSGSRLEIINALKMIIGDIESTEELDGAEWENPTLFTEINEA